jgi:cell division transport system permease protein
MPLEFILFWTRETLSNLIRNRLMSLLAMSTVAIGLFILGCFYLTLKNVESLVGGQVRSLEITVFLDPSITAKRRKEIYDACRIPQVSDLQIRSKQQELQRMSRENGIPVAGLEGKNNPLSDALYIRVKEAQSIPGIVKYLKTLQGKGIKSVSSDNEIVSRLLQFSRVLTIIGTIALIVLVLAILAIIYNTIRLTIHARRREIRIMELVGATRGFIRVPFVMEGIILGLSGGLIAALLLASCYTAVGHSLPLWMPQLQSEHLRHCAVSVVFAGLFFGLVGSCISLNRSITRAALQN